MIVCVGLNPALDRRIVLDTLRVGDVNRATSAEGTPGGKAAHVALAARALGSKVRFLGLLGGPTGQAVEQGLFEQGIQVDAVSTAAPTRINLELIDGSGVTEVLEPGEAPTPTEWAQLLQRCEQLFELCEPEAVVVFSGSVPAGSATYQAPRGAAPIYPRLIELAKAFGLHVILDTSGAWLEQGLAAKPDFVKPNRQEAEAVLKRSIANENDAKSALLELLERGAGSAIISLGAAGLIGTANARAFWVTPPALEARSAVGCGDATVAGLAVALERRYEKPDQLAFAAACGAANCLARSPGCLDPNLVESLRSRLQTRFVD